MSSPHGGDQRREKRAFADAAGRLVFAHECTIYTSEWKRVPHTFKAGTVLMPSVDPRFLVAIQAKQANPVVQTVSICTSGDRRPICSVDVQENVNGIYENRVWYIPSAKTLVTLPAENDRVVLRRLDVEEQLKARGGDYLFVLSIPVSEARLGGAYAYDLDVRSGAGGVRCKLEDGPEGMTVSPEGKVRWRVPTTIADKSVAAIILVTDASGAEVFHTYDIALR